MILTTASPSPRPGRCAFLLGLHEVKLSNLQKGIQVPRSGTAPREYLFGTPLWCCELYLSFGSVFAAKGVTQSHRHVEERDQFAESEAANQMCGCRSDSCLRRCEANTWSVAGPGAVDQFAVQSKACHGIIMLAISRNIHHISVEQQLYPLWKVVPIAGGGLFGFRGSIACGSVLSPMLKGSL